MWERGEPGPGADATAASAVPVQMWRGVSRCASKDTGSPRHSRGGGKGWCVGSCERSFLRTSDSSAARQVRTIATHREAKHAYRAQAARCQMHGAACETSDAPPTPSSTRTRACSTEADAAIPAPHARTRAGTQARTHTHTHARWGAAAAAGAKGDVAQRLRHGQLRCRRAPDEATAALGSSRGRAAVFGASASCRRRGDTPMLCTRARLGGRTSHGRGCTADAVCWHGALPMRCLQYRSTVHELAQMGEA